MVGLPIRRFSRSGGIIHMNHRNFFCNALNRAQGHSARRAIHRPGHRESFSPSGYCRMAQNFRNEKGQNFRNRHKCIVDNAIVDRDVYCEAFLSSVRKRLDAVNVRSIRNRNQFQIVHRKDFPFRVLHFQSAHRFSGTFVQNL